MLHAQGSQATRLLLQKRQGATRKPQSHGTPTSIEAATALYGTPHYTVLYCTPRCRHSDSVTASDCHYTSLSASAVLSQHQGAAPGRPQAPHTVHSDSVTVSVFIYSNVTALSPFASGPSSLPRGGGAASVQQGWRGSRAWSPRAWLQDSSGTESSPAHGTPNSRGCTPEGTPMHPWHFRGCRWRGAPVAYHQPLHTQEPSRASPSAVQG